MDYSKPILFIDLSYYVFYRYYALVNWYKLSQTEPLDIDDIANNTLFLQKFEKMFLENFKKLKRKFGVTSDNNVILAKDCARDSIWRMDIYPNYKSTRATCNRDFNSYVFTYTYNTILSKLSDVRVLYEDRVEADDIIGTLVFKIRTMGHANAKLYVVTNDMDYLQLGDINTHIENMRGVDLKSKGHGLPHIDLMYKIIIGDTSDNIPPVFKRCFKKNALEFAKDSEALESALVKAGPVAQAQFKLNKTLVDMHEIPEVYKRKIEAQLI
jgi:5'-3' exonuclease